MEEVRNMCGRFTLTVDLQDVVDYFQLQFIPDHFSPSFNIAPSQLVLTAIAHNGERRAGYMNWGLVPYWVKQPKQWKPLINARSESLTDKSSFKHLVEKHRCVIFADSFYEWKVENGKKTPYRIMKDDGKPFAFAALWDRNQEGDTELFTCVILTTSANEKVRNIHERMPVMLDNEEAWETWLNTKEYPYAKAKELLKPYPMENQKLYVVSSLVNSPKNNGEECIRPLFS